LVQEFHDDNGDDIFVQIADVHLTLQQANRRLLTFSSGENRAETKLGVTSVHKGDNEKAIHGEASTFVRRSARPVRRWSIAIWVPEETK
jgi:1,2-phenylacetyl-CoA epoxidase PaaB subunit